MDSGRLVFDPSRCGGVLVLASRGDPVLRESGKKRARSFFMSSEEVEEECYYDELLPEKKHRLTPEQVDLLERSFEVENKLEPERKSELARKLGVQPRQVAVWFQNRRARWKTKQLEHDFDRLKSSYDSLLVDHQSLLKDNDRLRSQVVHLSDKLQAVESTVLRLEDNAPSGSDDIALPAELKADDCLSAKSAGSAVLGEKLIDSSGDSYFPANYGNLGYSVGCVKENDCNFLHGALEHQQPDAGQIGWWDWS
ncbi:hypothetical protein J5N97_007999 [Dioscorea zingiberensis]|uniref:Homeobox-leucine zipper protein n=1 Tax=Dioscorea zingiberensis TaxID=325984 RepID=A0A9D5HVA6_9LILI|nr:hypothetical protein J5N97_007999 [Dioscorea zingiberensis]